MIYDGEQIESVEIHGFDEITQDDVLESFELYLTHKRKLGNITTLQYVKDYQAYMKELRYEEQAGANVGMFDET